MERAVRSPQSRHRKRRLLEATQHVSPPSERTLVESLAAQVAALQSPDQSVSVCVRVLRNVKNSVYLRALAARALGLLMLESRALADRLRLETEGLVDALLQLVSYCRRSRTQTMDTRRVHVNCCLVISLLMQAPSQQQQQHLQLVVSLDSDLLVLQPQPSERESANLLLTIAGRPASGDTSRPRKSKKKRRQAGNWMPSPPRAAGSTNQLSPPRQQHRKVAWKEDGTSTIPGQGLGRSTMQRRETPSRIFKMERHRLMTPVFPRQNKMDPALSSLPLIQPTGVQRMSGGEVPLKNRDKEDGVEDAKLAHVTRWDQWNKEHEHDDDEKENEPATPALKRQRLREILSSPVDPNEFNVRQLRSLAQRVNTSVITSLGSEITRLPGGAAYCRHRMRRAMALWILEFEDNQRRMALMQWKAVVEHARFLARGEEYHRQATKRRLKVAIEYVLRGYQQQGLRKWVEATQVLIWRDRDAAVANAFWHCTAIILLQVLYCGTSTSPQLDQIYRFGFQTKS
uniref:Uncharacterized protein n=1 Tax=Phytophthora ramorum TaxID=164328 RepID=H3HB58_PHYRM